MKKLILTGLITICTTCLCACIAACAYNGNEEHNWDKEWSHDERGHWHECLDDCGLTSDYGSHDWKLLQTLDYPTCGDVGLGVYACKVCDETKEDEISATGAHLWTTLDTLEATCYSKGYVTRNCAVCDTTETIELPATEEHIFNESKWASAGDVGHGHPCYNRDAGCTATSEPVAHDKPDTPTTIEPTDYDDGSISYNCTVCGHVIEKTILPATHLPVSFELAIRKASSRVWKEYDLEPNLIKLSEVEYSVTLFWDDTRDNYGDSAYPYYITCTAKYEDGSTGNVPCLALNYTGDYGIGAYLLDNTTGERREYLNSLEAVTITWWTQGRFRCNFMGQYRVAFIFITGKGDNRKERLTVYLNINVIAYTLDASQITRLALPLPINSSTTLYIDNNFKKRSES